MNSNLMRKYIANFLNNKGIEIVGFWGDYEQETISAYERKFEKIMNFERFLETEFVSKYSKYFKKT